MKIDFDSSNYEVNPLTMAIITKEDISGNPITVVMEEEAEYVVDMSPRRMMEYACKFFGSSLKGRQEGTTGISGITHKIPISIDPSSGMYFFPTNSPNHRMCSWISHSHIHKMKKVNNLRTEVIFKNGKSVVLEVSYGSMLNQVQRTAQFRFLLDKRIKLLQQQQVEMIAETAP
ncbi:competence protein [Oceanobacillus piezotolerans]|uniref:Competence protein n=1 Tax=Oceanobacillus piezotolerans TaxID=2448030 RepID=A0A498DMQ4_9BACI|nr:competence protein ComK [Oceanobacillus piezotolerans]RLL45032.1 competence protein [Oceanobacillus piezotolerans]